MILVAAGVSHKSAPLPVLEALAAVDPGSALARLEAGGWPEAVVLSTCNRFELYAAVPEGGDAGALERMAALLSEWAGRTLDGAAYRLRGVEAVRHVFSVASGLDSLVVGESEILGQVKAAYESARAAGMTGKHTNVLFQRALFVGKLARSTTGISAGQLSVASAAVALAGRIFGNLSGCRVLILGAGRMAELSAKHLLCGGRAAELQIANRTLERARALAESIGRRAGAERDPGGSPRVPPAVSAVPWEEFPSRLVEADIVIASTGSPRAVVTRDLARAAVLARRGKPLFIIDIAMPRDVEDSVQELDNVYLYTLEDLSGIVGENLERRRGELAAAQRLVEKKSAEFQAWLDAAALGAPPGLRHSPAASSVLPDPSGLPAVG